MIGIRVKGNFSKTDDFLNKLRNGINIADLEKYAEKGVEALSNATPVDTGLTAGSWYYEITKTSTTITISFCNSNIQNGWCPIAIMLQYGHGTRNGGWVEGRDYINPAIQPIFDEITNQAWREVTKT